MLRDRLVCGVNIDIVQKRLLAESKLTFEDALEIATSVEAATGGAQELMRETQDRLAVYRVGTSETAASKCYRCNCGDMEHRWVYRNCRKLDYIQ